MAIKYCNPDLTSGNDDGTSEADAFRTLAQCLTSGGADSLSAGDHLYIKKTSSAHDPGSDLTYDINGDDTGEICIEGYGTTIGDNIQFEITGRKTDITGDELRLKNISFTSSSGGSYTVNLTNAQRCFYINCKFENTGFNSNTNALEVTNGHGNNFFGCHFESDGNQTARNGVVFVNNHKSAHFQGCVFKGDQGIGGNFISGGSLIVDNCIFTGSTLDGAGDGRADSDTCIKVDCDPTNRIVLIKDSIFYDFDHEGIHISDQEQSGEGVFGIMILNNIFVASSDSGTFALENDDSSHKTGIMFQNNAVFNCQANTDGLAATSLTGGNITLTADPFVDGANLDFRLNNVAGAGAACRGVAFPTSYQGITGTNRMDLGAVKTSGLGERISVS